jgi:tetratricopeptide (TPR) repeat protein
MKTAKLGSILNFPKQCPNQGHPAVPNDLEAPDLSELESGGIPEAEPGDGYREVFSRVATKVRDGDRTASLERETAPISFAHLIVLPQEERLKQVLQDAGFRSFLLAEMFLERSRQSWHDDPRIATESAEVALAIAQNLDDAFCGTFLQLGLEARCRAFLANSMRIAGLLREASLEFSRLQQLLPQAYLEPYERAEILGLWAATLMETGSLPQAEDQLREVLEIYGREGDDQKVGRTLIFLGLLSLEREDFSAAVDFFDRSLGILEESRSPRLINVALLNLAVSLNRAGDHDRAVGTLAEIKLRLDGGRDRILWAKMRWTEGRIFSSLGQIEESESAYLEALKFFSDRDVEIDAALVCLDLAVLYIEGNRTEHVKNLAQRMLPVFSGEGFAREVMAALILFQHAAERELATLGLVQEISKYVQRAFRVPGSTTGEL